MALLSFDTEKYDVLREQGVAFSLEEGKIMPVPEFNMPLIIRNHSAQQMVDRLDRQVKILMQYKYEFITYKSFFTYETRNDRTPDIQ